MIPAAAHRFGRRAYSLCKAAEGLIGSPNELDRALQTIVRERRLLERAIEERDREVECEERAELARLKAKYEIVEEVIDPLS